MHPSNATPLFKNTSITERKLLAQIYSVADLDSIPVTDFAKILNIDAAVVERRYPDKIILVGEEKMIKLREVVLISEK